MNMKIITKTLIATSLTIAVSMAAQQPPAQTSPAQTSPAQSSSSDKSSSDKSTSSSSDKSSSDKPKGGTDSQSESTAGSQSSQSSQTITSLQQLSTAASDPTSLQGKRVALKDAKVKDLIGQDALTLTSEEPGKEILVKSQKPFEGVKAGETVSIMGLIRPMPQDPSQLGLDPTAMQKLQGQKFYIQARQVKTATE